MAGAATQHATQSALRTNLGQTTPVRRSEPRRADLRAGGRGRNQYLADELVERAQITEPSLDNAEQPLPFEKKSLLMDGNNLGVFS